MPIATPPPPIRLSVLGTRFNPGSQITVHLVAPPNGQAYALVCGSPMHFPLYPLQNAPNSPNTYSGVVPAPLIASTFSCPISAEFYDANGIWSYVSEDAPVFIGAPIMEPVEEDPTVFIDTDGRYRNRDRGDDRDDGNSQRNPTPSPSPSPRQTPVPKPVYTRYPGVENTPSPVQRPVVVSTPAPRQVETPAPVVRVAPVERVVPVERPAPVERVAPKVEERKTESSTPTPKATKSPLGR